MTSSLGGQGGKLQTFSVTFTLRMSLKDVKGRSSITSGMFNQGVLQSFTFLPGIFAPHAYLQVTAVLDSVNIEVYERATTPSFWCTLLFPWSTGEGEQTQQVPAV